MGGWGGVDLFLLKNKTNKNIGTEFEISKFPHKTKFFRLYTAHQKRRFQRAKTSTECSRLRGYPAVRTLPAPAAKPAAGGCWRSPCLVGLQRPPWVLPPPPCMHLGCWAHLSAKHFGGIMSGAMIWYFPTGAGEESIRKCPVFTSFNPVQFPNPGTIPQCDRLKMPLLNVCAHCGSFNHHEWHQETRMSSVWEKVTWTANAWSQPHKAKALHGTEGLKADTLLSKANQLLNK